MHLVTFAHVLPVISYRLILVPNEKIAAINKQEATQAIADVYRQGISNPSIFNDRLKPIS